MVAEGRLAEYRAGMTSTQTPSHSPLHAFHLDHDARMVPYAGWEMPMLYTSIVGEHNQTRTSGSLFDVSHMGRFRISGRHARRFLDRVCTRRILGMKMGQVRYSLLCHEHGGTIDDVLVYCFADDDYLVVCNGANRAKVKAHFAAVKANDELTFKLNDETEATCMVALQGPNVMDLIGRMSTEIPTLKRYRFTVKNVLVMKIIVSRTGYTGEDGVEVILGAKFAKQALGMMIKDFSSDDAAIRPAGLGARDSLRLEAGMPLYGHELTDELDPLSAGLSFAIALDKGDADEREGRFIGQEALKKIAAEGCTQKLVGLKLDGRRSARQGMAVAVEGKSGVVTSGCLSPTLGYPIALAYVPTDVAAEGTTVSVDLAGGTDALIVPTPFYKR
jgi:aminomethyltransferase